MTPPTSPSQFRSGLDHIYTALTAESATLPGIVDASLQAQSKVLEILQLAARAGLVRENDPGFWSLTGKMRRTKFRDGVTRQWYLEHSPFGVSQLNAYFEGFVSKSQLYYSLQRLRKDETIEITVTRDGSRTPIYNAKEPTV